MNLPKIIYWITTVLIAALFTFSAKMALQATPEYMEMWKGFGYPAFPVDTHIHRLAWRWGLTTGKNVEKTEKDLKRLFDKNLWNRLHLQIIFYGREHCSARGCDGRICEICSTVNT